MEYAFGWTESPLESRPHLMEKKSKIRFLIPQSEAQRSGFGLERKKESRGRSFRRSAETEKSEISSDAVARWSSGQDGGLSRPKREFDSPTGHQTLDSVR